LSSIDMFRMPYGKEPAVRFAFQALKFFTEFKRTVNRAVNQAINRITFHHRGCGFSRRYDGVVRMSGGMHFSLIHI
ncbi:hypothetical protein SE12_22740, partial [Salmonella enterica subsp. enterica serovar Braenderup]